VGRGAIGLAVTVAACGGGGSPPPDATPPFAIAGPALAMVHVDPVDNAGERVLVAVHGALGDAIAGTFAAADCGAPAGGAFVLARDGGDAIVATAGSTAAETVWTADRAIVDLPAAAAAATELEVCTPDGRARVAIERWAYTHVDLPVSPMTSAAPLATAADADGRVWVNEEFHLQLKGVDPPSTIVVEDIPQAAGPGIFAQTTFGDTPSHIATLGEAITVTPDGRVWFTESGPSPYNGTNPNHSRVIAYDPETRAMSVYNVPGDGNGVIGVAWDAARGRIWFTQARRSVLVGLEHVIALEARLTSFDPQRIPPDPTFAFAPVETCVVPGGETVGACSATTTRACLTDHDCVLATQVCPPGVVDDAACFHEYALPEVTLPAHAMVHSDGSIWYAAYWGGNHVGRLDPATGNVSTFPLSEPDGLAACDFDSCGCFFDPPVPCPAHCCQFQLLHWAPWSVIEEPTSGDVLFCGQTSLQVARIDGGAAGDSRCAALDGGENPCVEEWTVPSLDPLANLVHSIARGPDGRIWVSASPGLHENRNAGDLSSIGFLDPASDRIVMFPPISRYPFADATGFLAFGGAGIAIAPDGAIWFADYFRRRLGTLRPSSSSSPRTP
jgi:streptogramin lyase